MLCRIEKLLLKYLILNKLYFVAKIKQYYFLNDKQKHFHYKLSYHLQKPQEDKIEAYIYQEKWDNTDQYLLSKDPTNGLQKHLWFDLYFLYR